MISVIIPTYNNESYLRSAIQSVLCQTYTDYEIIVVDDGSTDNSRGIVTTFGDKVRYFRQENQGLAGARNTGIRLAGGELIGLLDADDEWNPDYLNQMVALSEKHPDALVFYCMARCVDVDGHDLPQFVGGPPVDPKVLYQVLLRANFIIPSTVTFRRKPIVEAGYFDANLRSCEDWDLWLRLLPKAKIVGTFRNLVRYRVHGSSLSTNVDGMHTATKKVVEKHFGIDDGDPASWEAEKRRAYGGVYRYQCITFVQRQNNWDACLPLMRKALQADPSLALDLNFFYELVLGVQSVGYRGVSELQGFDGNAVHLQQLMLESVETLADRAIRKQALGTTYYALGLAAYNSGRRSMSRAFFLQALYYSPKFFYDVRIVGDLVKSFLSRSALARIKNFLVSQPNDMTNDFEELIRRNLA